MASGKVHIGQGLFVTGYLCMIAIVNQSVEAIALAAGCGFSTWFLNPDNDLPSHITHHWLLLEFIWKPYQDLTTHRSFHTHIPVWSTFWRCVYVYAWFILPNLLCWIHFIYTGEDYQYAQQASEFLWQYRSVIVWFFSGLCVNDTLHFLADGCPVKSPFKL